MEQASTIFSAHAEEPDEGSGVAPEPADVTLRRLSAAVLATAHEVDELWARHASDGAMSVRLVEASHSLHRAALALQDEDVIGGPRPRRG